MLAEPRAGEANLPSLGGLRGRPTFLLLLSPFDRSH